MFNCPLSSQKAIRIIEQLNLTKNNYIVDIGCGEGELLISIAERYNYIAGIGIDNNSNSISIANQKAKTRISNELISFVCQDAKLFDWKARKTDLIISIGSEFILGGYRPTLKLCFDLLVTRAKLLLGTVFWKQEPSIEYLKLMEGENTYFDLLTTVNIAIEEGFTPIYICRSDRDEWDDFESRYAAELYLEAIQNADKKAFEKVQSWQRGYLKWGSDTMGFVFLLLQKL